MAKDKKLKRSNYFLTKAAGIVTAAAIVATSYLGCFFDPKGVASNKQDGRPEASLVDAGLDAGDGDLIDADLDAGDAYLPDSSIDSTVDAEIDAEVCTDPITVTSVEVYRGDETTPTNNVRTGDNKLTAIAIVNNPCGDAWGWEARDISSTTLDEIVIDTGTTDQSGSIETNPLSTTNGKRYSKWEIGEQLDPGQHRIQFTFDNGTDTLSATTLYNHEVKIAFGKFAFRQMGSSSKGGRPDIRMPVLNRNSQDQPAYSFEDISPNPIGKEDIYDHATSYTIDGPPWWPAEYVFITTNTGFTIPGFDSGPVIARVSATLNSYTTTKDQEWHLDRYVTQFEFETANANYVSSYAPNEEAKYIIDTTVHPDFVTMVNDDTGDSTGIIEITDPSAIDNAAYNFLRMSRTQIDHYRAVWGSHLQDTKQIFEAHGTSDNITTLTVHLVDLTDS